MEFLSLHDDDKRDNYHLIEGEERKEKGLVGVVFFNLCRHAIN